MLVVDGSPSNTAFELTANGRGFELGQNFAARLGRLVRNQVVATLRQARRRDISAMHRVRLAVRENRLASSAITERNYIPAIEETGRGWVIEVTGEVVAFAVGNAITGNIWALFVHPEHQGRGYGRRLHEVMIPWLFSCGVDRLWLSTDPNTRAQHFYEAAGWRYMGMLADGEALYVS